MKHFFAYALRAMGGCALFIGIATPVGMYFDPALSMDSESWIGLAIVESFALLVGYLAFHFARKLLELPTGGESAAQAQPGSRWRRFSRLLLRAVGVWVLFFAFVLPFAVYFDASIEKDTSLWVGLPIGEFLALLVGYLMFVFAENLEAVPDKGPDSPFYPLRVVLALCFIWTLALCLPVTGRIVFAVLLFVLLALIHEGWVSRHFGKVRVTAGDVLGFVLAVTLQLLVEFVLAALTGGRSAGITGDLGSFGGGGASGSW